MTTEAYWSVISTTDSPAEQSMTYAAEREAIQEAERRADRGATAIVLFHSGEESMASAEVRPWLSEFGSIKGSIVRDLSDDTTDWHLIPVKERMTQAELAALLTGPTSGSQARRLAANVFGDPEWWLA